ncbi:hypothetical protein NNO_0188 [Hydrogenimonas sp.]|nr:hypothetical protein NNO_0188 [Hydrogenimonas sp.]
MPCGTLQNIYRAPLKTADAFGALTGKRGFLIDIFPLKSRG